MTEIKLNKTEQGEFPRTKMFGNANESRHFREQIEIIVVISLNGAQIIQNREKKKAFLKKLLNDL